MELAVTAANGEDTIVVLTARSADRLIREGGSQSWVLDRARAKQCKWLVCTANQHHPDPTFADATAPHGTAFLIAKISGIRRSEEDDGTRWLIAFDEYALINYPKVWGGWRNPLRYTTLKELGISMDGVEFESVPRNAPDAEAHDGVRSNARTLLTIADAKKALAVTFGVKPEAVEITIRG